MLKGTTPSSKAADLSAIKGEFECLDRIGELPDDILIIILSHLSLKEAMRTCILSKRWINLWRYSSVLDFDYTAELLQGLQNLNWKSKQKRKFKVSKQLFYIKWVNQTLKLHEAPEIEEFRVCFDLEKSFKNHIDNWLDFAITKRVKRLELALAISLDSPISNCYEFPKDCLTRMRTPQGLSSIKLLTSLSLTFLTITDDILEHFLSSCPLLERLKLANLSDLHNLKVAGSSPFKLNYLEVDICYHLRGLEINAPNLVTFSYRGPKTGLRIENVSCLCHLNICVPDYDDPRFAVRPLSGYFGELETLTLSTHAIFMSFSDLPELTRLRHLSVTAYASAEESILGLTCLINACPSLEKLTLKFDMLPQRMSDDYAAFVVKKPHQSLKIVEMGGFAGYDIDFEFARYVFGYAVRLEKIILHTYYEWFGHHRLHQWCNNKNGIEEAKERAWELKAEAPPRVEFIVL